MRLFATTLITLSMLAGCGAKYKPGKAVVTGWDRTQAFAVDETSTVQYSGYAMVAPPVVPMIAFGAAFDLDVVVKSKHPEWDMHEWARVATPNGPMWVALESRTGTLDQVLVADVEDIDGWFPELPLARKSTPMKVVDRSTNDELDVTITYENMDNEEVEVAILGTPPYRFQKKRNGNTLGHSANQTLAVIDVPHRESLFKAKLKHDGRGTNVAKVAGFVPFQFAMEQVQGGLAVGSFYTKSDAQRELTAERPGAVVHYAQSDEPEEIEEPVEEPVEEVDPVVAAMDALAPGLQGCWTDLGEANAELEGRVLYSWAVDATVASNVTVVLDTVGNEALATCLTQKLTEHAWPEDVSGEVGFPINVVKGTGVVLRMEEESDEGDAEEAPAEDTPAEEPAEEEATEEVEAPEGDEMAEGDDEALSDEGDDLLGDDPDAEEETTGPAVIYNGIADFRSFHRMVSGNEVELHWDVEHQGDRVVATQVTPMRTLRYEYLVHYDSLELSDIAVYQTGRGTAVMHMDINPALPDLRRPFSGRAESNYVIDVNGQGGYATGTIEAWWSEGGPKVKVTPSGPEWNTGSMMTSVVFRDGGSEILVQKLGDDE